MFPKKISGKKIISPVFLWKKYCYLKKNNIIIIFCVIFKVIEFKI